MDFFKFEYMTFNKWWSLKKKELEACGYMDNFDIRMYKKHSAQLDYLTDKMSAFEELARNK